MPVNQWLEKQHAGGIMPEEILLYHPSKAMAFGHSAQSRNPAKAWDDLSRFLNKYTIQEVPTEIQIKYNTWAIKIDEDVEKSCINEIQQLFGNSDEKFCHLWSLNETQFEDALRFILELGKWNKQEGPPATLDFHCRFQWKENDILLAGQENGNNTLDGKLYSYCHFYIDYKVFIQPNLYFPYAYGESEGMKHLDFIKEEIPFRFSDKHLRRMLPTKAGRYRYLKV